MDINLQFTAVSILHLFTKSFFFNKVTPVTFLNSPTLKSKSQLQDPCCCRSCHIFSMRLALTHINPEKLAFVRLSLNLQRHWLELVVPPSQSNLDRVIKLRLYGGDVKSLDLEVRRLCQKRWQALRCHQAMRKRVREGKKDKARIEKEKLVIKGAIRSRAAVGATVAKVDDHLCPEVVGRIHWRQLVVVDGGH